MKTFVAVATVILALTALAESKSKWDGLKVKWGAGFGSDIFVSQPRTVEDAKAAGFELVGSDICGASPSYNGVAYAKGGDDYIVTVLYDTNGYIAGIQAGVTDFQTKDTGYPSKSLQPPFVSEGEDNSRLVLTAYFTDPSKICTEGRSQEDFDRDGDGEGLWIQQGNTPQSAVRIPEEESQIQGPWVKGKCFWTMGQHYWYDISEDMDCNNLFPVFLLYNGGQLNALGWAFAADLESDHFEHPGKEVFPLFMEKVPKCLDSVGTISTMHIYLTDSPRADFC